MKPINRGSKLAFGAALLLNASAALAAPAPSTQPVTVTNTPSNPVPTAPQGVTTVGGTVGATQSGTWNVNITGPVASTNADVTQVVHSKSYPANGTNPTSDNIDVSSFRSVRVLVQLICSGLSCGNALEIDLQANASIPGSQFPTDSFQLARGFTPQMNQLVDTPPQSIQIFGACQPGPCGMDVLVVGRRN